MTARCVGDIYYIVEMLENGDWFPCVGLGLGNMEEQLRWWEDNKPDKKFRLTKCIVEGAIN